MILINQKILKIKIIIFNTFKTMDEFSKIKMNFKEIAQFDVYLKQIIIFWLIA